MESGFDKISSSFSLKNQTSENRIDFDIAKPLKTGGSTCDTYIARVNGRLLFVKRLKEEYRNKPIYLNAFRKEFEVGSMLRHKSLPVYIDSGEDYLCLDYVDGQTLADMIANYDTWLISKDNVKRLLVELLDVLAYLHDRNVIHCDIKADNILLTYGSRNLFLIDLDKCYTSWFDNTAGSSEKYGLKEEGKKTSSIDFSGIGRLLETMERSLPGFPAQCFNIFKKECLSGDATIENLQALLKESDLKEENHKKSSKTYKYKNQKLNPEELSPREFQRLEWERNNVDNTFIVFDGPLKYNISKRTNEVSVECREDARKVCFEADIISPYEINGERYYVTEIPMMAFSGCINLKSIILPQGITMLYRGTFLDCAKLEYVRIPDSVETIIGGVFGGCDNLKVVEFENLENISISTDFIPRPNDQLKIIDLSSGLTYNYSNFIEKFGK